MLPFMAVSFGLLGNPQVVEIWSILEEDAEWAAVEAANKRLSDEYNVVAKHLAAVLVPYREYLATVSGKDVVVQKAVEEIEARFNTLRPLAATADQWLYRAGKRRAELREPRAKK